MNHGLPMLLSASVTPVVDIPVPFDARALMNKSRGPMLLEELTFLIRQATITTGPTPTPRAASLWWVKIDIGQHPLTNGFVPLMCMNPPYDIGFEGLGGPGTPFAMSFGMWGASGYLSRFWSFRWRLPKPLFIPRGGAPIINFLYQHDARWPTPAAAGAGELYATAALVGRALAPATKLPRVQDVPYVTAWVPTYVSGAFTRHSGEMDLKNVFQHPLTVQRLIGRAEAVNATAGEEAGWAGSSAYPVETKIKISTLAGEPVTRDPIQHSSFSSDHALLWTLNKELQPREGFQIEVVDSPGTTKLMYSLVGTRQERLWASL